MSKTPKPARPRAAKATSIRIGDEDKALIDKGAAVVRKSRTDFMVESSSKAAIEALLDARAFQLNEEQTLQLDAILTNPPEPVDKLRKLMASKAPWE
jgi:uncharacterized protein (DUF1778 family)